MNFASDNTGPAHPRVTEAVVAANAGYATPYGDDALMDVVRSRIRDTFEAPEAEVFLVATGTAANALALSSLVAPWQAVYGSAVSHIHMDECGALEGFSGGSKLILVPETDARMSPADLEAAITEGLGRGLHYVQPGAVSLTQVTERGTVYSVEQIGNLARVAHAHGLPAHMDGARFANAAVALGCTAAEMTWKAGVDVVTFGCTKNGCLGVEAVVMFDPAKAQEFVFRRKRGAHLFSKHRYLSAQVAAYLENGLWRDMAGAANEMAQRLATGLRETEDVTLMHPPEANMVFARIPRAAHRRAVEAGAFYFMTRDDIAGGADDDPLPCRLVTNWSTTPEEVDRFVGLVRGTA